LCQHNLSKQSCLECIYAEAMRLNTENEIDNMLIQKAQKLLCKHFKRNCKECHDELLSNPVENANRSKAFEQAWEAVVKYTNFKGYICQHKIFKFNCLDCVPTRRCPCGVRMSNRHVCDQMDAETREKNTLIRDEYNARNRGRGARPRKRARPESDELASQTLPTVTQTAADPQAIDPASIALDSSIVASLIQDAEETSYNRVMDEVVEGFLDFSELQEPTGALTPSLSPDEDRSHP
jgi:hypothetical protein